ncbi:prolyl 4-hydroxylase [Novosphingobium sp. SG751A]|uniref:prolyl hydroxylase family protein n=1 Tax=Novosphingobium sp. SG751A TaxID=2587000 RepID=UPI0015522265|nr:2OG-Fe(II) oxygenase [Novosphingobium sp. SG751A]NOW43918.1 prolyl 4-hydroxylase [Novosphingobium sp. SG751A]
MTNPDPAPDRDALIAQGDAVRARLDADPYAYRVPLDTMDMYAITDFLSAAECHRFMTLVDEVARPSATFEPGNQQDYRTSFSGDVDRANPFVAMIERRIDDLMGINPVCGEAIQGQRYAVGQEYRGHCDWFPPLSAYFQKEVPCGGQRSWTAMIYLNEPDEGGETDFMHVGVCVQPRLGMLLAWNNANRNGEVNTYTQHAAKPVTKGQKYVITKWYRTREWSARMADAE